MKVKKRDGSIVEYDKDKIAKAVFKAFFASNEIMDIVGATNKVTDHVDSLLVHNYEEIPVEGIQDYVIFALHKFNYPKTEHAYITYRNNRADIRNFGSKVIGTLDELTNLSAAEIDIKRENANINADTAMGNMLKYGTETIKWYLHTKILPKHISQAHLDGFIHIHDLDFYLLTLTCIQIDLLKLFKNGFNTGHGSIREPSNIRTAANLCCIAIQSSQNDCHGGQSIPAFDFFMAPYVTKTFAKHLKERLETCFRDTERSDLMSQLDFITEHILETLEQPEEKQSVLGKSLLNSFNYLIDDACKKTEADTYQAMEALLHNLCTMQSRAGSQTPFSSLNYGTDTSWQGRMVVKQLLLATQAGLGSGETPIFPVQIFKVKEGINYNPEDPSYDLFKLAIATSAKRLFPNFSFLDAPFNKQYYKAGDYNSEVAYMGCRTRVIGNVYDPTQEVTCGRGNISFTSINLPRIAIESQRNVDTFYPLLDQYFDLVVEQLNHRLKIQGRLKVKNFPFMMGEHEWLDSEKLTWDDSVHEVIKHGTLSIGFVGLAECLKVLTGCHHGESELSQKIGLEIVSHLRNLCDIQSGHDLLNYTLLATPAESLAGRFLRLDREKYGIIPEVTDREYYTNSFHVPVYYKIRADKKIDIEAPYHAFTNAGHITYVELDGDVSKNLQAFERIIRHMHDRGVGYGSVNHPVDRDPICGYTGIIGDVCPRCGRHEGEALSQEQIIELANKYHDVPRSTLAIIGR